MATFKLVNQTCFWYLQNNIFSFQALSWYFYLNKQYSTTFDAVKGNTAGIV